MHLATYLPLSTGKGDVDETAGVEKSLAGTALGGLLLLLGLNLNVGSGVSFVLFRISFPIPGGIFLVASLLR